MKQKNEMYKAVVLLISAVMVLSVIPAVTSTDTSWSNEFIDKEYEISDEFRYTGDDEIRIVPDYLIADSIQTMDGSEGTFDQLFFEDFEGVGLPPGWANYDVDGDGYFWDCDWYPCFGYEGAGSASYINYVGPLTPDNWLVTSLIDTAGYDTVELTFYTAALDPGYPADYIEVWISTTGNTPGDFTDMVYSYTEINDICKQHVVDLSTYNGQAFNVAFRHCNSYDWYWILLDDVEVTGNPAGVPYCDFWVEILDMDDGPINSLPTDITVLIGNDGPVDILEVKKLVDIYEKICGETTEIFNDDMEDYECFVDTNNENWTSVDNGDGDSWVLQEDCFHSPGQAYRNTWGKYRDPCAEDTYLGHAANSTNDELVLESCWDLAGAACAEITFWHETTGEYTFDGDGNVIPIDYGTVAISYDGGANWVELPISDFVAYNNPWTEVTIKIRDPNANGGHYAYVCDGCECDENEEICLEANLATASCVKIKFIWHTDPCLQFYGWCIDDVSVKRTEEYDLELVFQSHSIQAIAGWEIREETFPLNFDPEPDTWYLIEVCGQVFSPSDCEINIENNCDSVQFYVTDIHDMAAIDIECPPFLAPGTNGEYTVTVKNVGNFVENNVPVDLKICPVMADTYIEENFESGSFPGGDWFLGYFGGHNMNVWWDVRDVDAHSGDYSMMVPDTGSILLPNTNMFFSPGQVCDFTQGGSINWWMKWSLWTNDYIRVYSHHPDGLYWFGLRDPAWYKTFTSDFELQEWDPVADIYDVIWDYWPSYAPTHFPTPEFEFGWGMNSGSDTDIFNPGNPDPWSGVMIDDIEVGYEFCGDDCIVVDTKYTGVLAPGEEEIFTMYWNDTTYCNWCVCAETQLTTDINPDNDEVCCKTLVASITDDVFEYETIDLTDTGGDSLWHICCKHSFDPEPPRDCYYWNGAEFDTYAWYLPNTYDELISCTIDLTNYPDGAVLIFDTWYRFGDMVDHGEIYSSGDGLSWTYLGSVYGERDWHDEIFLIPGSDCTATTQVKFVMYSDDEIESDGWYIDDVRIGVLVPGDIIWEEHFGEPAPPCEVECPPGGTPEGEPCLLDDMVDIWNGGINSDPCVLGNIACGETVCGMMSTYNYFGANYRDTDWYEFTVTTTTIVTATAEAEFPIALFFVTDPCTSPSVVAWTYGDPCEVISLSYTFAAGSYVVFVSLDGIYSGWPCGNTFNDYWVELTCSTTADEPQTNYVEDSATLLSPTMGTTDIGLPGWTEIIYSGTGTWQIETDDYHDPFGHITDDPYAEADSDEYYGVSFDVGLFSPPIDLSTNNIVTLDYNRNFQHMTGDEAALRVYSDATSLYPEETLWYQNFDDPYGGVHATHTFAPGAYQNPAEVILEFYYFDNGGWHWSYNIDDIVLRDNGYSVDFMVDNFEGDYPACTWTTTRAVAGDYWEFTTDLPSGASLPDCDDDGKVWFVHDYPGDGLGLNNALDVTIDLTNPELTYADVTFAYFFTIEDGCSVNIEMAGDDLVFGTIYSYTADGSSVTTGDWVPMDIHLSEYLGQIVTLRFRYTTPGEGFVTYQDFGWAVDCFELLYKELVYTDELPPVTVACYDEATGTVTLFSQDQAGPVVSGVCNTYYKLNGGAQTEYFAGDIIHLVEGSNTLEFWSVDCAGNIETHHMETYIVDTSDPTISITAPEEGALYLFGNKIMNRILGSETLCIGKITIEADASDSGGINMVTFEIDGDSGYDSVAPYAYTYKQMKFGSVTATVTAHDMSGNTAQDTITFTIYSLGLL